MICVYYSLYCNSININLFLIKKENLYSLKTLNHQNQTIAKNCRSKLHSFKS